PLSGQQLTGALQGFHLSRKQSHFRAAPQKHSRECEPKSSRPASDEHRASAKIEAPSLLDGPVAECHTGDCARGKSCGSSANNRSAKNKPARQRSFEGCHGSPRS